MKSHPILTFSFLGNKERRLERTRKPEREPAAERAAAPAPAPLTFSSCSSSLSKSLTTGLAFPRFGLFLPFPLSRPFSSFLLSLIFTLTDFATVETKQTAMRSHRELICTGRWQTKSAGVSRSLVVYFWFLPSCLVRTPSTCKHTGTLHRPQGPLPVPRTSSTWWRGWCRHRTLTFKKENPTIWISFWQHRKVHNGK